MANIGQKIGMTTMPATSMIIAKTWDIFSQVVMSSGLLEGGAQPIIISLLLCIVLYYFY